MQFEITGVIREKESGLAVPGLMVRAYDADLCFDDLLGTAVTDHEGQFSLSYSSRDFRELLEHRPDIYLEVYAQPRRLVLQTKDAIVWDAATKERFSLEIAREVLGNASPGQPDDEVRGSVRLEADDLRLETTPEGFARAQLPGFADTGEPGQPALPSVLHYVALPLDGDPLDLRIHRGAPVVRSLSAKPYPAQAERPDVGLDPKQFGDGISIDNTPFRFTGLARELRSTARDDDSDLIHVEAVAKFAHFQVVALRVTPVRYDAVANALQFYPALSYDLRFDLAKARRPTTSRRRIGELALEQAQVIAGHAMVEVAKDLFGKFTLVPEQTPHLIITDNFQWPTRVDDGHGGTRAPSLDDRGSAIAGDMVAAFEKLARWKTARGVRSRVVTVSDIVAGTHGQFDGDGFARDLPEVIRNFIKHAREHWDTLYVLAAGDVTVVPMRELTGSSLYGTIGCGRADANPPDKAKAKVLASEGVVKLRPKFSPKADEPLSSYHGGLRIPHDREAGSGRLGWYHTTQASFETRDGGFERLPVGQRSPYVIVEGPSAILDDDYYWLRSVNRIPSDLYYASLVGSGYSVPGKHDFDPNNNGLYGQFHWDEGHQSLDAIDEGSDVWVGRAPADSGAQAEAFVDKVITYERLATPDGETDVDSSYLQKIIYAAAVWGRLHYHRQNDHDDPPAAKKFTHEAGTTTTRLQTHFDLELESGVPNYRIVANTDAAQIIVPYDPDDASANNPGWYFTTSDDYETKSPTPTRFIELRGSESTIDPNNFYLDPVGLEGSVKEKEAMRALMDQHYPAFSQVQRHYQDHFELSPPPHLQNLVSADVMAAINAGVHFLSLTGHGSAGGCCGVSATVGDGFTNDNRFFIAYADSCSTARPDGTDSLAERAVVDPDGGAVGYIGNTRYSWIGVGDNYERFFWQALDCFGRMGPAAGLRLGADGKRSLWAVYAQNLFGDPEMPVWTEPPKSAQVSHAEAVTAGENLTVNVYESGLAAKGHKITVLAGWTHSGQKPKLLQSKTTAASGTATFAIPASLGTGPIQVTVTRRNYKPRVSYVEVELPVSAGET